MKVLDWDLKEVELNEVEGAVYASICDGDSYEFFDDRNCPCTHPSDVYVKGLSVNQIKGYLSALSKKHVIHEVEFPNEIMVWAAFMTDEEIENAGI